MILPNKYITITESFIGLSAILLDMIKDKTLTIEKIWTLFEKKYVKNNKIKNPPTHQKFIYVIDFMYLTGMISYNEKGEILNENIKFKDNKS